mgnify:CR=1 FL=1|jgi:NAD+ kinase
MAVQSVGLVVNRDKWEAVSFAHTVIAHLTERDLRVCVDADSAGTLGREDLAVPPEGLASCDLLVTLGGDGTILAAAQAVAPHGVPIVGVHMGRFGFIAEFHPQDLLPRLEEVLEGRMTVEDRMMVSGQVIREGAVVHQTHGLNDVVINKGTRSRMLHLETEFDGEYLVTYPADGVVVATPTGSTAYALSAGGPLLEPTVQALLVVPICPHTLAARPIVMPSDHEVSFVIESDGGEVLFITDSLRVFPLASGDKVRIRRAECTTRIVTQRRSSFYGKIRKRLLWGERLSQ